jgi:DNA repair protein RadC
MRKLKDLSKQDLPREKLAKYGPDKLTDAELLAIILGSGTKGMNVLSLSRAILKRVAGLGSAQAIPDDLKSIRGLGAVKRLQIVALLALAKRLQARDGQEILSVKDVWNMCNDFYASAKEHFVAFYLDTQSRLIERKIISVGTLDANIVHPRDVYEPALTLHAASVVVAHNHPSGDTKPSPMDIVLTKKLADAAQLLGISLDDHIIVSKKEYTSMKQKGLI